MYTNAPSAFTIQDSKFPKHDINQVILVYISQGYEMLGKSDDSVHRSVLVFAPHGYTAVVLWLVSTNSGIQIRDCLRLEILAAE